MELLFVEILNFYLKINKNPIRFSKSHIRSFWINDEKIKRRLFSDLLEIQFMQQDPFIFLQDSNLFIFDSSILIVLEIVLVLNDDQIPLELFQDFDQLSIFNGIQFTVNLSKMYLVVFVPVAWNLITVFMQSATLKLQFMCSFDLA